MSDIFISYAREDLEAARRLAEALETQGWSVFWDRTIPAGKTWREVIGAALANARCVVVLWSQQSVTSHWVLEEADQGLKRRVLIPVFIENVESPLGFGSIQAADLSNWGGSQTDAEIKGLFGDVTGILGPSPVEAQGEERRKAEAEAKRKADDEQRERAEANRKVEGHSERAQTEARGKARTEKRQRAVGEAEALTQAEPEARETTKRKSVVYGGLAVIILIAFGLIGLLLLQQPESEQSRREADHPAPPEPELVRWGPVDGRRAGICIGGCEKFVPWLELREEIHQNLLPQVGKVRANSQAVLKDYAGRRDWIVQVVGATVTEVVHIWFGGDPQNDWSHDGLIRVGTPNPVQVFGTYQRYSDGSYHKLPK